MSIIRQIGRNALLQHQTFPLTCQLNNSSTRNNHNFKRWIMIFELNKSICKLFKKSFVNLSHKSFRLMVNTFYNR